MNKEKLWGIFLQQNPRLATDPCLTPESLRRFFDLTWNAAYEAGCHDMAERHAEITDGDMDAAAKEAAQAVMSDIEEALSAVFGGSAPIAKIYATKKANKKKTDPGGK
jgi:transketolase